MPEDYTVESLIVWLIGDVKGWTKASTAKVELTAGKPNERYITLAGIGSGNVRFYPQAGVEAVQVAENTKCTIALDKLGNANTDKSQFKVTSVLKVNNQLHTGNAVFLLGSFRGSVLGTTKGSKQSHNADTVSALASALK